MDKEKEIEDQQEKGMGEYEDKDDMLMSMPMGATSFAELDQMEEAKQAAKMLRKRTNQFNGLIDSIMMSSEIEDKAAAIQELANEFGAVATEAMNKERRWQPLTDKAANLIADHTKQDEPMKTEGGVKFPASDFAYVPDPDKPSTWKLRLAETPGKITRSQLGAAAAAFSEGGFRGNRVELPSADVPKVKAKIRAAYKKLGVDEKDIPASIKKELNSFLLFKQKDDTYRWLAIYSNKFRDRDNPPEIIAEASHVKFINKVNSGDLPYPELWLWHVPASKWGQSDFLAWDDNGFAVASGTVDKGKEWIAESLQSSNKDLLTSHGMPQSSVKRDPADKTIIIEHQTKEISPLPSSVAANEFTGFILESREVNKMLSDQDKAKLSELGIDPERVEAETESKAKETEGLEYKETEDTQEEKDYVSRDEMAELVKSVAQSTNKLVEVVGKLSERIDNLESNKQAIDKETLERTPAASLTDLYKSVIGSEEAKVDGRTTLAKDGPEEAPAKQPGGPFALRDVLIQRNQEIVRNEVN